MARNLLNRPILQNITCDSQGIHTFSTTHFLSPAFNRSHELYTNYILTPVNLIFLVNPIHPSSIPVVVVACSSDTATTHICST